MAFFLQIWKPIRVIAVVLSTGLLIAGTAAGQRTVSVFLDPRLPASVKSATREMSTILGRSQGLRVQLDSSGRYKGEGIYFTVAGYDYYAKTPASLQKMGPEAVYIQSGREGVYAVANSPEGFSNAVFTYLDKIGFRFYFPDPAWHIVPDKPQLFASFEILEEPDYQFRSIFMGWGYGSDLLKDRYLFWERANRMGGILQVKAGHMYQKILADKIKEFQQHPDYLSKPLINGKKQSKTSFNFASDGLANLAHQWLAEQFDLAEKKGQYLPMLSLEPFDGPNFCDLPACLKIGDNAGDQIFFFTNKVAAKLKTSHPGKLIGVLAYNDHIDIPKYPISDNVFVTLTTSYNNSSYSVDQLIDRWKTKVKRMGIYDYMSVFAGTNEMPGKGFAGNYLGVAAKMKSYFSRGIVSYQSESTYGWIPKGLSHYLASRLTWNTSQSVDSILDKFYNDCFPKTQKWIRPVFESWTKPFILTEHDIYTWFNNVKEAFDATNDPAELGRIHQLALYLKYVALFKTYDESKTNEAQNKKAATELFSYMNQIMETGVVASYAGINTLAPRLGNSFAYNNKEAVWRTYRASVPASRKEWDIFFAGRLSSLKRMQAVESYQQVPFVEKKESANLSRQFKVQNRQQAITFSGPLLAIIDTRRSDSLQLQISGGRVKLSGTVSVQVFKWNDELKPQGEPLLINRFQANRKMNKVSLSSLPKDRYLILASDSSGTGAQLYFPQKMSYSIVASPASPVKGAFYNNYYFYVPKNTKVFYITKTHYLQLFDPAGNRSVYGNAGDKLVEVKVKEGSQGWWRMQMQLQDIYLTGVPPLLSRDPLSFFLPE